MPVLTAHAQLTQLMHQLDNVYWYVAGNQTATTIGYVTAYAQAADFHPWTITGTTGCTYAGIANAATTNWLAGPQTGAYTIPWPTTIAYEIADGQMVNVPVELTRTDNDVAFAAWCEAAEIEAERRAQVAAERQRAREMHNQAERERELARLATAREAEAARKRARRLLLAHLTEEQREQYEAQRHFDVRVGQRLYRIEHGSHGNVYRLENGRRVERFCIAPNAYIPHEDSMLAQKLNLEADEAAFLRVANRTLVAA